MNNRRCSLGPSIAKQEAAFKHMMARYEKSKVKTQMTNPTNPPAEAAMQPLWVKINKTGRIFQFTDREWQVEEWKQSDSKAGRISELMERAEHERVVAEKDVEIAEKDKEIERLREALRPIAETIAPIMIKTCDMLRARAALQPETKG